MTLTTTETAARAFALRAHGDQRYGAFPYIVHLDAVHRQAVVFDLDPGIRVAAFLHDVLEDTATTPAELHAAFGPDVAGLVEAVTGRGPNRRARVADAHPKIVAGGERPALLKACDRIANGEASESLAAQGDEGLLRMYWREHPAFRAMVLEAVGPAGEGEGEEAEARPHVAMLARLDALFG